MDRGRNTRRENSSVGTESLVVVGEHMNSTSVSVLIKSLTIPGTS